jgi:uncharacterized membrane protein YdjX (TVP38/TMEM64 family)
MCCVLFLFNCLFVLQAVQAATDALSRKHQQELKQLEDAANKVCALIFFCIQMSHL